MSVRAKFRVERVTETPSGFEVELSPVVGGSEENDVFYKYTPAGKIGLSTINKEAAAQFVVGQEMYVDFTPAEPS